MNVLRSMEDGANIDISMNAILDTLTVCGFSSSVPPLVQAMAFKRTTLSQGYRVA